jgi:hypothetical protein
VFLLAAATMGVGNGIHSIAEKGIMAKLWEKERRGGLMGTMQAITGAISVVVAVATFLCGPGPKNDPNLSLLWGAAATALLATGLALLVREPPRERRAADRGPLQRERLWAKAKASYAVLARARWYRRFLASRVLLLSVEYGTAFYAIHAASKHGGTAGALAVFSIATALGVLLGGIAARQALRRSDRLGLGIGGGLGCLAALGALGGEVSSAMESTWIYAGVFFVLSMGNVITNTARNAYFLASADEGDLENGLALTKVLMEPVTIAFVAVMGALAQFDHPAVPIAVIGAMSLGSLFAVLALPASPRQGSPLEVASADQSEAKATRS